MNDLLSSLDLLPIVLSAAVLMYASRSDIRSREVSDRVWMIALPMAAVITAVRIVLEVDLLLPWLTSIVAAILVSMAISQVGLFGGADAKAMITLAVALPSYPGVFQPLLGYWHPFFPLTVLTNTFLMSMLSAIYVVVRNVLWRIRTRRRFFEGFDREGLIRKLLVLISGYRVELSSLGHGSHLIPMEDVNEVGGVARRRLRVYVDAEEDFGVVRERLERCARRGIIPGEVWVTPGLPMLVFVAVGFFATLLVGDLLFAAIQRLVGVALAR